MDKKSVLKKFKAELRQALKDIEDGKGIPLAEFDWGLPPHNPKPPFPAVVTGTYDNISPANPSTPHGFRAR